MDKRPLEFSNRRVGRRVVETADGIREVRDLRELGCPDEIATRIERRNAERAGTISPEVDGLKDRLAALNSF